MPKRGSRVTFEKAEARQVVKAWQGVFKFVEMKPSEQAQVNFISDCLRKGEQRKDVLAKFVKKWQGASVRTFDRRLRQSEITVSGEQERIKEQAEQEVSKEADALKSKLMTSLERQAILAAMARGELETEVLMVTRDGIKKAKAKPTHAERRSAIAELNKMDGSYSAQRIDLETTVTGIKEITIVHSAK